MSTTFDHEAFARDVESRFAEVLARLAAADERPLYTPETLAVKLGTSPRTVREMLKDGVIPSFKVGGLRRVSPGAVDEYIAKQETNDARRT